MGWRGLDWIGNGEAAQVGLVRLIEWELLERWIGLSFRLKSAK